MSGVKLVFFDQIDRVDSFGKPFEQGGMYSSYPNPSNLERLIYNQTFPICIPQNLPRNNKDLSNRQYHLSRDHFTPFGLEKKQRMKSYPVL